MPRQPRDPHRKRRPRRLRAEVVGTRTDGKQVIASNRPGKCDRCERWYPTGELLVHDTHTLARENFSVSVTGNWVHDGCLPEETSGTWPPVADSNYCKDVACPGKDQCTDPDCSLVIS